MQGYNSTFYGDENELFWSDLNQIKFHINITLIQLFVNIFSVTDF